MRAGDALAVAELFEGATDQDRARMRPVVEKIVASFRPGPREALAARQDAASVAVFACYSAGKIRDEQWRLRTDEAPVDLVLRAVASRTPRFRQSLAKTLLASEWTPWTLIRALVKAGAIDPSVDDDAYVRHMVRGLEHRSTGDTYDFLVEDLQLLDREVWRIFEVSDAVGWHTGPGGWIDALARLGAEGRLDRDGVLDGCCAALATDFRPGALGWFIAMWAAQEPTVTELAARKDRLLGLLASPESTVAKVGLDAVRRLDQAEALDRPAAAEELRSPLSGPRKNVAMAALGLLERWAAAAAGPEERDRFLGVVASGLGHQRPDVAERAFGVIQRLARPPGEALRLELLGWVDAAPPTLRAGVAELAGVPAAGQAGDGPPLRPNDVAPPVQPGPYAGLRDDRRLAPVEDLDDLVGLFAAALEGEGSADDVERALAGVLRGMPAHPGAVSPRRKRALRRIGDAGPATAPVLLAGVVLAWTDRRVLSYPGPGQFPHAPRFPARFSLRRAVEPALPATPRWFLQGRLLEVMRAVAKGRPVQALAEPTHEGGRVDPRERGEGRGRAGDELGPYDRRLAVLRAPDDRWWPSPLRLQVTPATDRHPQMRASPGVLGFGAAADGRGGSGPADPLIEAAVRFFGLTGQERFNAAAFGGGWDLTDALGTRMGIALYAARPDVPAAWGAAGVAERNQQASVMNFDPQPMIDALADPAIPLTGPAASLLALAMAGSTQLRAAAVDVAVAAVEDGRFDPLALARDTAALHGGGLVVLSRLSQPMSDLAASGQLHRLHAQQFLLALVAALPGRPTGLHAPLETLAQLSAGGVDVPSDARAALADLAKQSSKAGKAAKAVLASAGGP